MLWPWWHQATGPDAYRIRELLRGIWDLHAMYGTDEPWLWRGQANADYGLEPAMHTRVRANGDPLTSENVREYTNRLVTAARLAQLDSHEGMRLPDMALLAMLQHHGAATPLLDVSLDPLVGLYMATVSPDPADDLKDGVLFGIRRPKIEINDYDSRTFASIWEELGLNDVAMYSAPDVSERLRIQRGHFLLGRVSATDSRITIPLTIDARKSKERWITKRMAAQNKQGPPTPAIGDLAVFRVTAIFKDEIRRWLEARSGLTRDFVFPTSWHQPHLDRFASSHGRKAAFR